MTSSLGIAAVTAVLRTLFENAIPKANLNGVLGNIDVSALPPDRITVGSGETSRLNLFLYQVQPNQGWRNTDLPSHDASGRRVSNPPLALDLHYMLSAYGAGDFHAEILLGYGALLVHRTRVLTREAVRAAFTMPGGGPVPADLALLSTAGLDGQEELVKLSMSPLSVDDISRLWAVFGEKYRPSVAFTASVLLLRGDDAAAPGLPVQQVRLAGTTSTQPTIDRVDPQTVTAGSVVYLSGSGLLTPDTTCRFGSGEQVPPAASSTAARVRLAVPATLRAGLNTVRVSHAARFGADLRPGPESNAVPFMLRPVFAAQASPGTGPDVRSPAPGSVTARLVPPVGRSQAVALLLNPVGGGSAYTVPANRRDADPAETTDTVTFAVTAVAAGDYLARVRVDGAETVLDTAADGTFTGPVVSVA